ncbi:MAG: family 16 glycoside hydrolase [Chitinophagaceae bacterium]
MSNPFSAVLNKLAAVIFYNVSCFALCYSSQAQTTVPLNDLSFFKQPGNSWSIVMDATADPDIPGAMAASPGTGVLLNLPNKNGADLFTSSEYGDLDLELDYMMAKGSNSGIYLQGRYEVQLLDSWMAKNPTPGDNGGIYERWDESRPVGKKGYEGYAPRQNVSKAPGLWQHIKISFQAPRFDESGKKTENAKMLRVTLNGVNIHEDVTLQAVTRGAISEQEASRGPVRFQGDHGSVAFRDIKITSLDKPRPQLTDLNYTVYKGRFNEAADIAKLPPEAKGTLVSLSANTINKLPSEYFIKYTGTFKVAEPGEYTFTVAVPGGRGIMQINRQLVNNPERRSQGATLNLPAGNLPFELLYTKMQDWTNRSVALAVSGPGIRQFILGDIASASETQSTDPIYIATPVNTILRSFMDIPMGIRVVHAVSVGSPEQVHYTYDMDHGAIIQVWRGNFLDATPMWHDRGDGSARPLGVVQRFGNPLLTLQKLDSGEAAWITDTTGTSFVPKGYKVNKADAPTFLYQVYGLQVEDAATVIDNGQGIRRQLTVANGAANIYARLAGAGSIVEIKSGMYLVDEKAYYIRIDDAGGAKPIIRDQNGQKELIIPVQNKLTYSILF